MAGVHDAGAEGKALVAGVIAVGLSAVIGLTGIAGGIAPTILRYLSGGTCEIVGTGGTMVGTGFTGILPSVVAGSGYQIRAGDPPLYINASGNMYFISSGATSLISFIQHRTADFS
jgi:hypothetical protein